MTPVIRIAGKSAYHCLEYFTLDSNDRAKGYETANKFSAK
jgi:hypothetical protein